MQQSELNKFIESDVADLSTETEADLGAGLARIELTVKKMQQKDEKLQAVPLSSLCTSACFSSISSIRVTLMSENENESNQLNVKELVRMHDKALEVMGQDALVDAAIAKCVELESK
jgi:hypothetical protein